MKRPLLFLCTVGCLASSCSGQPPRIDERQGAAIADPNYLQSVLISPQEYPGTNTHEVLPAGYNFSYGLISVDPTYQRIFWSAYQNPPSQPYNWVIQTNWPFYADTRPDELAGDLASGYNRIFYDGNLAGGQGSRDLQVTCGGVTYTKPTHYYLTGAMLGFNNGAQAWHVWHSEPGYSFTTPSGPCSVPAEYHYEWIVLAISEPSYPDTLVPDPRWGAGLVPAYTLNADGTTTAEPAYICPGKVVKSWANHIHVTVNGQNWTGDPDATRFCIAPVGPSGYPNVYILLHPPFTTAWLRMPEKLRHPRWNDQPSSNALFHLEPFWGYNKGSDSDQIDIPSMGVFAVGDPARTNPWHVYELDLAGNYDGSIKYYGWMSDDMTTGNHFWNITQATAPGP
jgi:hypothetical protein